MISEDTLQIISKMFCGDIGGYYSYKTGPKLVSFFNSHFNFKDVYKQGFPSRWAYTYDKLAEIINSGSYDEESCRLVGEIVNVCADERILNAEGKIDLTKFSPITYDPVYHTYRKLGEVVGQAFSEGLKLK